jgi:hypothetical protein
MKGINALAYFGQMKSLLARLEFFKLAEKQIIFNGKESTVNRALGGSTYPG